MSSTRERALNAAVTLVGTDGIRALTHARIDAAASLPPGSTSNHFRTRAALLSGVIAWIAEHERADAGTPGIPASEAQLAGALTAMIQTQSGPLAARTRARFALFLEAGDDDALRPLHQGRAFFEDWISAALMSVSGADRAGGTFLLMAACDGLLLHRLTVDPDVPIEESVRAAVRAALQG